MEKQQPTKAIRYSNLEYPKPKKVTHIAVRQLGLAKLIIVRRKK